MANEGIRVPIGGDATEHNRAVDSATKKAKGFGSVWEGVKSRFVITAGDMVRGAGVLLGAMSNLIERGGTYGDVMGATSIDVKSASDAVGGLITNLELARAANQAAEAGMKLTDERFQSLAKAATIYAQKTGGDATQALNQLITALATGAPETLRRFGISLDAVSDSSATAEERLVSLQEQGLDKMTAAFAQSTVVIDDVGEHMERVSKAFSNSLDELGRTTAENELLIDVTRAAADAMKWFSEAVDGGTSDIESHWVAVEELRKKEQELADVNQYLTEQQKTEFAPSIEKLERTIARLKGRVQELADEAFNDLSEELRIAAKELAAFNDEADGLTGAGGVLTAETTKGRKVTDVLKKKTEERKKSTRAVRVEIDAEKERIRWIDSAIKRTEAMRAQLKTQREEAQKAAVEIASFNQKFGTSRMALAGASTLPDEDPGTQIEALKAKAKQARQDFTSSMGVSEGGSALANAILGPPGEFDTRMSNAHIAIGTLSDALKNAGEQLLAANISEMMEMALGPSVQVIKASAEESANSMGLVGKKRQEFIRQQKHAEAAEKAMQLSSGERLKVATRDALKAIATKAAIEGAFKIASAIFPPNPALAASGAALLAVAAAAGLAAKAIGPVKKKALPPIAPRDSDRQDSRGGGGVGGRERKGGESIVYNVSVTAMPGVDAKEFWREAERGINNARRTEGRTELQ